LWIIVYKEVYIKALELAKKCADLALDKKAIDPIVLEVKDLTAITDYFVICSGTSSRHIRTIADEIVDKLKKKDIKPFHFEADETYEWVVVDLINVIVHIFSEEKRGNYRLEHLWGDAKQIKI
jgi:ribosome-associated protein